jgi:hypothetical protein
LTFSKGWYVFAILFPKKYVYCLLFDLERLRDRRAPPTLLRRAVRALEAERRWERLWVLFIDFLAIFTYIEKKIIFPKRELYLN